MSLTNLAAEKTASVSLGYGAHPLNFLAQKGRFCYVSPVTTFRDVLPEALADELKDRLVSALQHVYAINSERYNPELGDDGLTFGVQVWRNSWYELEAAVQDIPEVVTSRPDGSLVIRIGEVCLHSYKVGNTEQLNVNNVQISGTATKNRIVHSNFEQLQLFSTTASAAGPPNLVLVHTGNSFDGLCAAWVGAPTEDEAGPSWHWVEMIYQIPPGEIRRGEPMSDGPVTPYSDLPVTDFDLTLKPERGEAPGSDES